MGEGRTQGRCELARRDHARHLDAGMNRFEVARMLRETFLRRDRLLTLDPGNSGSRAANGRCGRTLEEARRRSCGRSCGPPACGASRRPAKRAGQVAELSISGEGLNARQIQDSIAAEKASRLSRTRSGVPASRAETRNVLLGQWTRFTSLRVARSGRRRQPLALCELGAVALRRVRTREREARDGRR